VRILNAAGAVLLVTMLALGAWSLHCQTAAGHRRDPDLIGILEVYGQDTLTVLTITEGVQQISVPPDTVVTLPDGPGTLSDLRPGALVAVWRRPHTPESPMIAAKLLTAPIGK
jgi:hypothetical protein